jgi:capsular polysaccharide biosynthesis protein/Mrp family chromosome partitioning ATPase
MDERAALKTITNAVKHRLYVLIAIVAVFTLGAGIAALIRPASYQGTALLFVDERFNSSQGFDLALQAGELLSAHFIQTATSRPVLERACSGAYFDNGAAATVTCDATTLAPHVSATTVKGTSWIGVSATARTASESAMLANAVGQAMIDQNRSDVNRLIGPTLDTLNAELKTLSTQIQAEQATIGQLQQQTPPGQQAPIAGHQANLALLQTQYSATYAKSQDLLIEENQLGGSLTLVQAAIPPLKPYDPNLLIYLAVGLVAGLCVGLLGVVLLDRFDDRLFEADALSLAAGTRLVIAVSPREARSLSSRPSEPYTLARANLLAQHPHLTKILVVAASPHDRVRAVAAGLGMAGVKAGQRVLVVDAEASTYVMHQQAGRNGSKMTIVSTPASGSTRIADEALADADGKYDLTIFSAPSPHQDPTAVSLARTADIAIVVATARVTRFSDVKRTVETLRSAGIQIAASILATESAKEVETGAAEPPEQELYEMAVNQLRLPTWRGPSG